MRVYLSACTIYRDAAPYLAEWIEFHLLAGVERLFLYDNGSTDEHRDVLGPYLEEGTVVLHDWPMPFLGKGGRGLALTRAFDHCLREHRDDARWIAFLDVDEFLFSPTGSSLSSLLPEYEAYPAVCVSRAEFGPSGHHTRPEGLVIENYTERRRMKPDARWFVKSIVDPARTVRTLSAHTFLYRDGEPVDERHRPLDKLDRGGAKPISWERFRVNHYGTKSVEERDRKAELWREVGSLRLTPMGGLPKGVQDEVLLAHGPAVREAIARRGAPVGRER